MTNEEKDLARQFCGAEIGAGDFRSCLRPGVSDAGLPAILIGEALADRDASALELSIASLSRLRMRFPLESLESVLFETWHRSHEDIVRAIADLREPKAIPALVRMVHWVPDYLMWDQENRVMASKAVHGLGWLRDHPSACEELELVAGSKWKELREIALRFSDETSGGLSPKSVRVQKASDDLQKEGPARNKARPRLTGEEKELAKQLYNDEIDAEAFRSRFQPGATDDEISALLIEEALADRSSDCLEIMAGTLMQIQIQIPIEYLILIMFETWHVIHEDLVGDLSGLRDPRAIPTLIKMVHWVPDYLMWDVENRAISRKAVYGLGWLKDHPAANEELKLISKSECEPLRKTALRFLENKQ